MIKFVMGVTMKLYLFTLVLFSQLLMAIDKNERDDIKQSLVEYLQSIDQKNVSSISKHFYFDRRGWDRGPVFCFGEGTTREFSDLDELKFFFEKWSNAQSKTYNTHIEELQITLLFDGRENRIYNADAITKRLDSSGKVIKKQRNLYYFQSDKLSNKDDSWTDWKIYMISNIEI